MSRKLYYTRSGLCDVLAESLLTVGYLSGADFRTQCARHGQHEPSRVLDELKNRRGIPLKRATSADGFFIDRKERAAYATDPVGTLARWRAAAQERAAERRLQRLDRGLAKLAENAPATLAKLVSRYKIGVAV